MKILLSIKPEFANKIFNGSKKFEFRRLLFKNKDVNTVVVYASAPVSKVIGEFDIEQVLKLELNELWIKTKEFSGISKEYYDSYFVGKNEGFALKIKNPKLYSSAKNLKDEYGMTPPQSFAYL
jgi:predicted transcriptional regulator